MASYVIVEGTTVRFYTKKPFANFSGTAVDPDEVQFAYCVQDGATHTFTYVHGTGDPTGTIVRDGVGLYHADIDTANNPGQWTYTWRGIPTALNADPSRTKVVAEGSVTISVSSV